MNKIIITGHGNFASGIYSSLELISGPKENVLVVDFLKEDSDDLLRENIKQLINDDDNYLVILCAKSENKETKKIKNK